MTTFTYIIRDEAGIHARPAGLLAARCRELIGTGPAVITLTKGDKSAGGTRLFALMGLGIKKGDPVTVTVEGGDEAAIAGALKQFFEENL